MYIYVQRERKRDGDREKQRERERETENEGTGCHLIIQGEMCIDFRCLLLILTAYRRLSNISKDLHTLLILRISCKFLCFVFTCIACYWF